MVGDGRMGRALVAALPGAAGPFGRGFDGSVGEGLRAEGSDGLVGDGRVGDGRVGDGPVGDGRVGEASAGDGLVGEASSGDRRVGDGLGAGDRRVFDAVLLAVPDREIAAAARAVLPGPMVGHCAGAWGLDLLVPHEAFGLHPLMTVTLAGASFTGAGAAVAGTTERALAFAHALADALGMSAFTIADNDRAAYHAAATLASNFLVTLEDAAETVLRSTGAERRILVPLVRAALENWAELGGPAALTGPIARGDEAGVTRQRAAVEERTPELLALFDALADATRALAQRREPPAGGVPC